MNRSAVSSFSFSRLSSRLPLSRGLLFGLLIIGALLAFEIFNYSTTDFALNDLLGNLTFASFRWSTILAIAFCGIDFAGIARLFTPEQGADEPKEIWYLFGAWLLAATMNAALTWWGVSIALVNHQSLGGNVVAQATLVKVVPIFVAVMVWLIRILIIGTFAIAGERLFSMGNDRAYRPDYNTQARSNNYAMTRPAPMSARPRPTSPSASMPLTTARALMDSPRGSAGPSRAPAPVNLPRPEPTYHPVGMAAGALDENAPVRR
jgi:hypothetical protein